MSSSLKDFVSSSVSHWSPASSAFFRVKIFTSIFPNNKEKQTEDKKGSAVTPNTSKWRKKTAEQVNNDNGMIDMNDTNIWVEKHSTPGWDMFFD